MCAGIAAELDGIHLGDERLNRRSKQVIETLAANPEASINAACEGWAETLAAYRFFDNPAVTAEKILQPHREATVRRMREQAVVLMPQDTTEFDFTSHPPRNAQCLNTASRFGLYDHTHLAVTPDGLCLGVVGQQQFVVHAGKPWQVGPAQSAADRRKRIAALADGLPSGLRTGGAMSRHADRQRRRSRRGHPRHFRRIPATGWPPR